MKNMDDPVRIGIIYPDDTWVDRDNQETLEEIKRFLPEQVEMATAHQYTRSNDSSYEEALWLAESTDIEIAAKRLMRFKPTCFAYLCTTTSFIKGIGHDTDISNRITLATGMPAITTSTAVVKALKALNLKKVTTASPYLREVDRKLTEFLEGNGIKVVNSNPLSIPQNHNLNPSERIRRAAEESYRQEAEGIFISCTGQKTARFISDLENSIGKPVVTSNQATMWVILQMVGIKPNIKGLGRLYTL